MHQQQPKDSSTKASKNAKSLIYTPSNPKLTPPIIISLSYAISS